MVVASTSVVKSDPQDALEVVLTEFSACFVGRGLRDLRVTSRLSV